MLGIDDHRAFPEVHEDATLTLRSLDLSCRASACCHLVRSQPGSLCGRNSFWLVRTVTEIRYSSKARETCMACASYLRHHSSSTMIQLRSRFYLQDCTKSWLGFRGTARSQRSIPSVCHPLSLRRDKVRPQLISMNLHKLAFIRYQRIFKHDTTRYKTVEFKQTCIQMQVCIRDLCIFKIARKSNGSNEYTNNAWCICARLKLISEKIASWVYDNALAHPANLQQTQLETIRRNNGAEFRCSDHCRGDTELPSLVEAVPAALLR